MKFQKKGEKNEKERRKKITCWIIATKSFKEPRRLLRITAAVKYLKICGQVVWMACLYLRRKK